MNERVLVVYFIIQLVVQFSFFYISWKIYSKLYFELLPKGLNKIDSILNKLYKDIHNKERTNSPIQRLLNSMKCHYMVISSCIFFIINILISVLVKLFTNAGAMSGMTNLFASVVLGLIIYIFILFGKRRLKWVY